MVVFQKSLISAVFVAALIPVATCGQTVSSPIVGFVSQTINASSDTVLKVSFQQNPIFAAQLVAPPVSVSNQRILVLNGEPQVGVNELGGTHYVRMTSGASQGSFYAIDFNRGSEVTITVDDDFGQLTPGDRLEIVPWWTFDSLLPPQDQPENQKAAGNFPPDRGLELYLFEETEGVNFSPSRVFFLSQSGWKESTAGFPDAGGRIIPPSAVMVLRSRSATEPWKLVTSGQVDRYTSAHVLQTRTDQRQDNIIGLNRPVPMLLSEMGLASEQIFQSSLSTSPADRKDELLVIDNSEAGLNRLPSAVYFKVAGQWREDTDGFPVSDDVSIEAESGIIIRKAPTATGDSVVWINEPNYP